MRDRTCPEYGRAMELVGRPRPWVAGVAVVALVLLLTWVTSGPYVNLFAPFDDEEPTGGGGAAGSYERYSGLEDVARGSASGGIWLIVLGILASCAVLALLVWAVSRHGFRLPLRRRARPDGAAVASHTPTSSPDVRGGAHTAWSSTNWRRVSTLEPASSWPGGNSKQPPKRPANRW